jgi:hypothetical protein
MTQAALQIARTREEADQHRSRRYLPTNHDSHDGEFFNGIGQRPTSRVTHHVARWQRHS